MANFFRSNGWSVECSKEDSLSADLLIRHGKRRFIVESRHYRRSPRPRAAGSLYGDSPSQSCSRAVRQCPTLAIIFVPEASLSLAKHVEVFAQKFAKDVACRRDLGRGDSISVVKHSNS